MDGATPQIVTNGPRSMGVTSGPSSAPTAKARSTENAYEKLSRDVHQMTSTGAIHHDWLENPKGFLLKPDFKRKLQHVGAGGKKLQAGTSIGIRLHMPGSTYRLRWFVLDGMVLRYFKTQNEEQELGAIHLASVNAVLPSSIADAPEFALDLVCADRIYTIAGNDREDMVRWATVLTLVLREEYRPKLMQRPESTIIRGSAAIPRPSARKTGQLSFQPGSVGNIGQTMSSRFTDVNSMRRTGSPFDELVAEDEVKEKIITITFEQLGPLQLRLRGTVEDEVMICGFQKNADGTPGFAEASRAIREGDFLISINQHYFTTIEFDKAIEMIQRAPRPLTLRFSRLEDVRTGGYGNMTPLTTATAGTSSPSSTAVSQKRVAEGWVLAKEQVADRYRIRILQLYGDVLRLYKPSLQGVRVENPCLVVRLQDITDIRPTKDTRETTSAYTQCHPKRWGVALEGQQVMFTFYTKSQTDMTEWIDYIKNSPLFSTKHMIPSVTSSKNARISIPVHPIAIIQRNIALEPRVLLQDSILKLGDISPTLALYVFVLYDDGRFSYFINNERAQIRTRPVGTVRCDNIIGISASQVTTDMKDQWKHCADALLDGITVTKPFDRHWRLELNVRMYSPTTMQKFHRPFTLYFVSRDELMKWAIYISREASRLTSQKLDITFLEPSGSSLKTTKSSKQESHDILGLTLAPHQPKCIDTRMLTSPPLYRSLKDATNNATSRGWFFVKRPRSFGLEEYHPRFIVLSESFLHFYKHEIADSVDVVTAAASCAAILDLRRVKDAREVESGQDDFLDFALQLTTADDAAWVLVSESYSSKERWLSTLIWLSDYYYRGAVAASPSQAKLQNSSSKHPAVEPKSTSSNPHSSLQLAGNLCYISDDCTSIRSWLEIAGRRVYASIACGVFSYYEKEHDCWDEWGDALGAFPLENLISLSSVPSEPMAFAVTLKAAQNMQFTADSAETARRWMLIMCSSGNSILERGDQEHEWHSTPPKEAWIWKLDRVYQIFRRRFFSLRNHQLLFYTKQHGRPLGVIALPSVLQFTMSKVCDRQSGDAEFYQLDISFSLSDEKIITKPPLENPIYQDYPDDAQSHAEHDPVGDFHALSLAFMSESEMLEWAHAIHHSCSNSMSIKDNAKLPQLLDIRVLPKELLKISRFEDQQRDEQESIMEPKASNQSSSAPSTEFNARGWLYYLLAPSERLRLRYFVQWGHELSIYKHEILADEYRAIRYGVIDCRALQDVRFAYVNSPENAVELQFSSNIGVVLIPQSDEEAVMWRNSLLEVKRAYGCRERSPDNLGSGVFICRTSTFSTNRDHEELLRSQIESSVIFSSNLQEWDGRKWIPKYFVLTTSRLLILSLAVHLYDEEPDILASYATKYIFEVRSCTESEMAGADESPAWSVAFLITIQTPQKSPEEVEKLMIRCDSQDHCLEWMRLLCSSNGKLELKKNAATGYWGSVNRVASMFRHESFTLPKAEADTDDLSHDLQKEGECPSSIKRKMSRQDAARRRTSELIMNRRLSRRF